MTIETYPLTFILFFFAISITGINLYKLYFIEQFRFFCENDSVEEANTAIYLTPTYKAVYIPFVLGTRHGYDTPYFLFIATKSYFELAIWGIHFGDTKEPTSIDFRPHYVSLLISCYLVFKSTIFF